MGRRKVQGGSIPPSSIFDISTGKIGRATYGMAKIIDFGVGKT
jgi:hypothetical protein